MSNKSGKRVSGKCPVCHGEYGWPDHAHAPQRGAITVCTECVTMLTIEGVSDAGIVSTSITHMDQVMELPVADCAQLFFDLVGLEMGRHRKYGTPELARMH